MKYSIRFNQDYEFYLSNIDKLDFCGSQVDLVAVGDKDVKRAFFDWDSQGKLTNCDTPELLRKLMITKKSVNLHIKMWAEGRLEMTLPRCDWEEIQRDFNLPEWAIKACDNQMSKIYNKKGLSVEAKSYVDRFSN
jgi:hypothetical protein